MLSPDKTYQCFGQEYRLEYLDLTAVRPPRIELDMASILANIASASTASEVFSLVVQAANSMGFESATYGAIFKRVEGPPVLFVCTPLPLSAWETYHAMGLMEKDEMVLHCSLRRTPGVWRIADSMLARSAPELAAQLARVWASRIFVPLFGPLEETGVFAWNSSHPMIDVALGSRLADVMMQFQLIAVHAHERICNTGIWAKRLSPEELQPDRFTDKEKEVLVFLSKGNKVSEIASLMGIAEVTVNYHLKKLKKRLFAETTGEMLARAAELGITKPRFLQSLSAGVDLSPFRAASSSRSN